MMNVSRPLVTAVVVAICFCACKRERADVAPVPSLASAARAAAPAPATSVVQLASKPAKYADAAPVLIAGKPTGFAKLPNDLVVRTDVRSCPSQLPTRGCPSPRYAGQACAADADCTAGKYGYCHRRGLSPGCSCDYGCLNDSDCGTGQICMCSNPVGMCVDAQCTDDSACRSGTCATYFNGIKYTDFSCRDGVGPMEPTG